MDWDIWWGIFLFIVIVGVNQAGKWIRKHRRRKAFEKRWRELYPRKE